MKKIVVCFLLGLATLTLSGAGQAPPPLRTIYNREDLATLNRVSDYLNSLKTLESGFIQIDAAGRADEGRLYIARPGRIRFEYSTQPVLWVSDGRTVAIANTRLNTVDKYSFSDTPLAPLFGGKVDLARNPSVVKVVKQAGSILVYARTANTRTQGNIIIVFSEPQIELRQWSVTDNQGQTTTVTLRDPTPGAQIDDAKFVLPVKKPAPPKKPG
jgi:outer membrane lipoprotein-sorting protein